ncbi:hypothetical protein ACFL60_03135 [Candidatus Omnitrophota bacterium]
MRTKYNKLISILPLLLLLLNGIVHAGECNSIFTTEITYKKNGTISKVRPIFYKLPSEINRIDVMFGRIIKDFTVSGYVKSNSEKNSWFGIKGEYGKTLSNDKISAKIELRYFYGLTNSSINHSYFIPSGAYSLRRYKIGVLGYGKKFNGKNPVLYASPLVGMKITKHISAVIFYGVDVLNDSHAKLLFMKAVVDI